MSGTVNLMKVLAMYLPQFHRVKENDAWWGDGFTEWTTVRAGKPLFAGHEQPHVPLGGRYYDLMNPDVMRWQAELMHRAGVDGMCFYHYYFKDGRRILERPAENLLKWQDIDMPFCFSWANESWVRSWSRFMKGSNPWAAKFDPKRQAGDDGVLLEQDYGDEMAWRAHYAYLSPFFHDCRYIMHENMPVFLIYQPDMIPCLREMLVLWDRLAQADGFDGVYAIGTNMEDFAAKGLKGAMRQEPQDAMAHYYAEQHYANADHVLLSIDYHEMWRRILGKPVSQGTSLGAFVGYDDTPRREHGGSVIRHRSPEVFRRGMEALFVKAEQLNSPYIFLNAWNEWGEGMYLEPDERFGDAFLKALHEAREAYEKGTLPRKRIKETLIVCRDEVFNAEKISLRQGGDRYRSYWKMMDLLLDAIERHVFISAWLRQQGFANAAIYGNGMLGRHLLHRLGEEQFPVHYLIDRRRDATVDGLRTYTPEDNLPPVDVILVTAVHAFPYIKKTLAENGCTNVLRVDEVLSAVLAEGSNGGTK